MLKKTVPEDFIAAHGITTRQNGPYFQLNASDVNRALKEYKIADTFCILAITNQDLYPREEWNFGLANMTDSCGTFSFHRHQETDESLSDTERH